MKPILLVVNPGLLEEAFGAQFLDELSKKAGNTETAVIDINTFVDNEISPYGPYAQAVISKGLLELGDRIQDMMVYDSKFPIEMLIGLRSHFLLKAKVPQIMLPYAMHYHTELISKGMTTMEVEMNSAYENGVVMALFGMRQYHPRNTWELLTSPSDAYMFN